MNIYRIRQSVNNDYDTFDSAVVYASTEKKAGCIHPSKYYKWNSKTKVWAFRYANGSTRDESGTTSSWCLPVDVKVRKIGETKSRVKPGVILASFNAG